MQKITSQYTELRVRHVRHCTTKSDAFVCVCGFFFFKKVALFRVQLTSVTLPAVTLGNTSPG